jgi:hypothetical protein
VSGDSEVTIAHEMAAYLLGRDHALADEVGGCEQCDDTAGLDRATWFAHEVWRIYITGMADVRDEESTD